MGLFTKIDEAVQTSRIGKFFEMEQRGTKFSTELQGAMATFMSMAYILAVNPRILADSGGPCTPDPPEEGGIFGPNYSECIEQVKREYITSTAIGSCFGCLLMGLLANLPIALAPGMGMNAYFTYSVVGFRGTGNIAFESAVTAVLIEGGIFLFLAVSGIRYAIVKFIPEPVRLATPAAIGAFLAHLGLQTAEGIGIVVSDIATAVTLGACPLSKRTPIVAFTEECKANTDFCVTSDAYTCDEEGGVMTSATTWVGILGMMIILVLLSYRINSAFVIGIGFITFISWFRNTSITYFPNDDIGNARFDYFKKVVSVEKLDKLLAPYSGNLAEAGVALFTFLYVDFLDTSGTLLGLAMSMGFVDEEGNFPRSRAAFSVDALATMFGSVFGLSPVTSFIESGAGVEAGSRTGLTAVFCGIFFFLSIFFAPIIASIPPWATGGSLIIVGSFMASSLAKIKWYNISHAATAFVTVMVMPLTYSIAYGLIGGLMVYFVLEGTFLVLSFVGIPKPSFEDPEGPQPTVHTKKVEELDDENSDDKVEAVEEAGDDELAEKLGAPDSEEMA